jgi:protein-disulfide isomerase
MTAMNATRRNVIALGAAALAAGPLAHAAAPPAAVVKPPLLGDANAPKRLVLFGSYTCVFTAALVGLLMPMVTDMKGKLSVEWRHFPAHPPDPALHVAGLAFKDAHFWNFMLSVMRVVYAANGVYSGLTPEKLAEFAKVEGGSAKTLEAAYADQAKWAAVKQDLMAGKLLGITRTPGLFHNGYFLTPNGIPQDLKAFDKSLREMIAHG